MPALPWMIKVIKKVRKKMKKMFFLRKPSTNNQFILLKFTDSSQDSDFVVDLASLSKKIGNNKGKLQLFMTFTLQLYQYDLSNLVHSTNFYRSI